MALRAALEAFPKLSPGIGFRLEGDGQWDVQEIPDEALEQAVFSGYLEIEGYQSAVFETPDGHQWAQKQPGTPAPKGDEAVRELLSSDLHLAALRVAGGITSRARVEPGLARSLQAMMEELAAAEAALDLALQHGRRLRVEPDFEWIVDRVEAVLAEFKEFRKGAQEAAAYALPEVT